MIKRITPHNFLTTPFVAVKSWELFNVENDDILLLEPYISGSLIPDTAVAQDYVDYYGTSPVLNSECNIALEQQTQDVLIYQEGLSGSGKFFPDSEPTNPDGTYKRLVYNTINKAFYNKYNDPTKIFGVEYIDFPLGRTVRNMADDFRLFNVPQMVYGDKIVPGTVQLYDTSLDDNMVITDDGYQNLIAGYNLFSKVQEVRNFGNTLFTGSATASCPPYGALAITSPQDYYADISSSAFFYTTASGTTPFSYQWQTGSTNVVDSAKFTGSNSATLIIKNAGMGDMSSSYRVLVNNPFTGITSSYATLYINLYPPTVNNPDDISVNYGGDFLFDVTASLGSISAPGALPLTYVWQSGSTYLVDDARITGSTLVGNLSSSLFINNVTYADSGSYRVMVSNYYGGVTSSYADGHVDPPPTVDSLMADTASITTTLVFGSIDQTPTVEDVPFTTTLITGSLVTVVLTSSGSYDSSSVSIGFYTGSLNSVVLTSSGSYDSSSVSIGFYTGSLITVVFTSSGSYDSSSVSIGFYTGSLDTIAIPTTDSEMTSFICGLISGSCS